MRRDDHPDDWGGPRTTDEETRRRLDNFLSLLGNQRRRDLLYHLATTDVTDVETLATNVAAVHEQVPVEQVSPEDRKRVQQDLLHTHLPKLADVNAIEFDPRSEVIRCREFPPMLERLLGTCHAIEAEG